MCFTLNLRKEKDRFKLPSEIKPKIAKKDIIVYKKLYKNNFGQYYNLYIRGKVYPYKQGYIYSETTPFKSLKLTFHYNWSIEVNGHAFHSYVKKPILPILELKDYQIVEMIIPKGSLYYCNNEEYVSNQLYYP